MLAAESPNEFRWSYLPGSDLKESIAYPNGDVVRWEYEPKRDLLTLVSNATHSTYRYTYDAAGNRMTRTEGGETVTYTLGVGDRLASYGRADAPRTPHSGSYTHDAAGNVTRIERDGGPTLGLTWNSRYQLASVSTNGAFAERYAYDALNRRVSTTTLEGTTRHVYDNNWQVIADIDEQGNVIASYTWCEGIDKLLAVTVGGATYYALTDIQGTVWGYVDSHNNVVARWQYDAWGNVLSEEIDSSAVALSRIRYRFQGREWSVATGLINFRMRWYDAETGRWLSKDPIRLSGGLNLYAFCYENPVALNDSSGLCPDDCDDEGFWDRYFQITNSLMINPLHALAGMPIVTMPKRWAPATDGRAPAFGSKNEWTSLPQGFGVDKIPNARDFLRSPGFRGASAVAGAAIWGVGYGILVLQ